MGNKITGKITNLKGKLLYERILTLNLSIEKVCDGICSETYLREALIDNKLPHKLIMDSLMQRIGMQTDNYESIVSREEYEIIKQIDKVISHIDKGNLDETQRALREYERMTLQRGSVYDQLLALMVGISRLTSGSETAERLAYDSFIKAIRQTISNYAGVETLLDRYIDRMELILHVLIIGLEWKIYYGVKSEESASVDKERVMAEIQLFKSQLGDSYNRELGGVLAYYGQYICEMALERGMRKEAEYVSGMTLKMLKNISRIYNVTNLLEIWSKTTEDDEKRDKAIWMRQQIIDLYKEFGIEKESNSWCIPYATNEVYPIDYVVKTRRCALGISQEKLAEGICSNRTISNIEKGKYSPQFSLRTDILRRLGVNYCDYGEIESFDEKHHNMMIEYSKAANTSNYFIYSQILAKLKKELPNTNINNQFFELKSMMQEIVKTRKRDVKLLPGFINALERTCKVWNISKEWIYMGTEVSLIYNIGEMFFRKGDIAKATQIFSTMLELYKGQELELKHFLKDYSMIKCTYASWVGNYGDINKSLRIGRENIDMELKNGAGSFIARQLYDIGWDMEKIEYDVCGKYKNGIRYMRYAYAIGMLLDEAILLHIEKHVKSKYNTSLLH